MIKGTIRTMGEDYLIYSTGQLLEKKSYSPAFLHTLKINWSEGLSVKIETNKKSSNQCLYSLGVKATFLGMTPKAKMIKG